MFDQIMKMGKKLKKKKGKKKKVFKIIFSYNSLFFIKKKFFLFLEISYTQI
jgi:hypothetical protein